MTHRNRFRFPRGSVHIVLGLLLLSPLVYNPNATQNAFFVVPLAAGLGLLVIGILRFRERTSVPAHDDSAGASASPPGEARDYSVASRVFALFAVLSAVATALGLAYMVLHPQPGGMSGVPLGFGLVLAGVFVALALASRS